MSDYHACPRCGRTCKETFSSNHFPIYKCGKCGTHYCNQCARDHICPKCGATAYQQVGKVYAVK